MKGLSVILFALVWGESELFPLAEFTPSLVERQAVLFKLVNEAFFRDIIPEAYSAQDIT